MRALLPRTCGCVQLGRGSQFCQLSALPCLPSATQPRRRPNSMHCTLLSALRTPIETTFPTQALSTFQCSCAPNRNNGWKMPLPHSADGRSWANSPRICSPRASTCRCLNRKSILSSSSSIASVCKCNRGLRCQLSCAKYPISSLPISGGNPNGPGIIMHTYHGRHVVATRPGPLHFPMPIGREVKEHRPDPLPRATIICRCN
jgi:hypothetical protein